MIAEDTFLCGISSDPAEALLVCVQEGCRGYAFTCGRKTCDCNEQHSDHSMAYVKAILKKVVQPVELPANLARMEKDISTTIDSFIQEMQALRVSHRQYIKQHTFKQLGGNSLRWKLAQKKSLDTDDATGDCFWRMLQDFNNTPTIANPYRLDERDLEKLLLSIRGQFSSILQKIVKLWKPQSVLNSQPILPLIVSTSSTSPLLLSAPSKSEYRFSNQCKHAQIACSVSNSRVTTTEKSNCFIALVVPHLSMEKTSKVSFQIHQLRRVELGICYRNMAEKQSYQIGSAFKNGLYVLGDDGKICSHSEKGQKSTPMGFKEGEIVSVELNPSTGLLTFFKDAASFSVKTDISSTTSEPVSFCVRLSCGSNSINIV